MSGLTKSLSQTHVNGIDTSHGLYQILLSKLDLHRPFRLQDATAAQCNIRYTTVLFMSNKYVYGTILG